MSEAAPLTFEQERLWLAEQLRAPEAAQTYLELVTLELDGPLDVGALRASLEAIVARHPALRTRVELRGGVPVQVVDAPAPLPLELVDEGALWTAARQPIDVRRGPILRAHLARRDDGTHLLALSVHHLVFDAASGRVLLDELAAIYPVLRAGRPLPPHAPSPSPLAERARQQRDAIDPDAARAASDWRARLAADPPLEWPTLRRPRCGPLAGARQSLALDAAAVRALAASERATPFVLLLAAFGALLGRICDRETLTVGVAVDRRDPTRPDSIGFFVDIVPVRLALDGDPSLRALVRRAREAWLAAEEEWLPSSGALPLQAVLAFQAAAPSEWVAIGDVRARLGSQPNGTAKFELSLCIDAQAQVLAGYLEHARDVWDDADAQRLAAQMGTLVRAGLAAPDQPLSQLPLDDEAAQRSLVALAVRPPIAPPGTVGERVRARAQAAPDAIALDDGTRQLSYRALVDAAERVAAGLVAEGLQPGEPVGVSLPRGCDEVIAQLAVLLAGGCYLPLDPAHPAARRRRVLEDAGVRRVLEPGALPAANPATLRVPAPRPDDACYLMYTSGSTGAPKGVRVPHRAVTRLVDGAGWMRFSAEDVWLRWASSAFDASVWETWGALVNGARLAIAAPGVPTFAELAACVRAHRVTTLLVPTPYFHALVDAEPDALLGVTQLVVGGDALSAAHARRAVARHPSLTLVNAYGPTENGVVSCARAFTAADPPVGDRASIGRPIDGTSAWVVDARGRLAPLGVPGELWVGGAGVALGYLGAQAGDERFVPDGFGRAGGVLYRTGDRVRWRPDGELEFLGRLDAQVKIRGVRVEPAEVEAALRRLPGVRNARVLTDGGAGERRLVAYLVGDATDDAALTAALADELPEAMVPSVYVRVPALPLDGSGKLDRARLTAPVAPAPALGERAPETPVERALAEIWREVLGVQPGLDDDFFRLGGHSLAAARILARVRDRLGVELTLRDVFRARTLAALAARVDGAR